MKPQLEIELDNLIVNWVRKHIQTNRNGRVEITEHTDLMTSGLLDSITFVELVVFIETQIGRNIDLTDVDPEEFSTVNGLSRIALNNSLGIVAKAVPQTAAESGLPLDIRAWGAGSAKSGMSKHLAQDGD
jgi:acyl carrier protein